MILKFHQRISLLTAICIIGIAVYVTFPSKTETAIDTQLTGPRPHVVEPAEVADLIPNFAAKTGADRKKAFVDFVLPFVEIENQKLTALREELLALVAATSLDGRQRQRVDVLVRKFRVSRTDPVDRQIEQLLNRVDNLPTSLVLAQAAIESAWGTSRFARQGNNLFGHWCMVSGCGLVPLDRPQAATYEVRKFDSVQSSVHQYFMNLNTNRAYLALRKARSCQRKEGEGLSGAVLASGLMEYSAEGHLYVDSLRKIIRVNEWEGAVTQSVCVQPMIMEQIIASTGEE